MSTIQGFQCSDFYIDGTIDPFETDPYRFNSIHPWTHSEDILKALTIIEKTPQGYKDPFWEARQLIDVWNYNREIKVSPSYISFLDESRIK